MFSIDGVCLVNEVDLRPARLNAYRLQLLKSTLMDWVNKDNYYFYYTVSLAIPLIHF